MNDVLKAASRWGVAFAIAVFARPSAGAPHESLPFPSGQAEVAYRQLQDGKSDDVVFLARLSCYGDGSCELQTIMLNYCFPSPLAGNPQGFSLTAFPRASTSDRDLKVSAHVEPGNGYIVAEEMGAAKTTYRFEFTLTKSARPGGGVEIDKLTGFSGVTIENSVIQKKLVSITLVPLKGEWSFFEPKCRMILPGVPQK